MSTKSDPKAEKEACDWIASVTGKPVTDITTDLKSGVLLCETINALRPGTIKKISTRSMAFMQMENIEAYCKACTELGIPSEYNFMTVDLFEAKNISQVTLNVLTLRRTLGGDAKVKGGVADQVSITSPDQTTDALSRNDIDPNAKPTPSFPVHGLKGNNDAGIRCATTDMGFSFTDE
eukprot:TRINITY_DN99_c0_g1_i1.p1 TRINITY_DN99_c0_g1~~TRINITY_DN99_c0_g1_i1.p1  ORF type:complete len:190 (+),score=67.47 TRINITY_DN99_c0_g1_i1:39-572(+)